MGHAKRESEEKEFLEECAKSILVQVGAIKECDHHEGEYYGGSGDLAAAYKLANAKITRKEVVLPQGWERKDFTDIVKEIYEENQFQLGCSYCSYIASKDD